MEIQFLPMKWGKMSVALFLGENGCYLSNFGGNAFVANTKKRNAVSPLTKRRIVGSETPYRSR
jgi:hypothetical protein